MASPTGGGRDDGSEAIAVMQRKVPQTMFESVAVIEDALAEGPWPLGADYSICEPTCTGW